MTADERGETRLADGDLAFVRDQRARALPAADREPALGLEEIRIDALARCHEAACIDARRAGEQDARGILDDDSAGRCDRALDHAWACGAYAVEGRGARAGLQEVDTLVGADVEPAPVDDGPLAGLANG